MVLGLEPNCNTDDDSLQGRVENESLIFVVHEEVPVTHRPVDTVVEFQSESAERLPIQSRAGTKSPDVGLGRHIKAIRQVTVELQSHNRIDPGTTVTE